MIYQSLKMALKSIGGNKMRSFLTILGVVIGVVAIVVLVAIAQGANASVVSRIESMGTNLISVNIRARWQNPITLNDLKELSQDPGIAYVAPTVNVSGTVKAGVTTYDDGTIQGTTPGYEEIRNYKVHTYTNIHSYMPCARTRIVFLFLFFLLYLSLSVSSLLLFLKI